MKGREETYDLLGPGHSYETITGKVAGIILNKKYDIKWILTVVFFAAVAGNLIVGMGLTLLFGVGLWGNNQPVGWAFGIINFVWWIGIGHAGTLISAILLILHQNWRTSINRFAEAMTIFAVVQAGQYPLLHVGRHQYAYWMFPLPNSMSLWPQFRSPLMWDVFAISTYMTVSVLFWLVGLIPDFAVMRDRAQNPKVKMVFGMLAMGWRGSAEHWKRYTQLYLLLAGLSTPLVLSVHTIVSFDFSVGIVPGWHSTIFPPYFVAGAVFAGFAMTLILAIPLRAACNLRDIITMRHLENMGKVMLGTGLIVFYGYIMEVFFGWYSANKYEMYMTFDNRMFGPYRWAYWSLILCNGIIPQLLWIEKVRQHHRAVPDFAGRQRRDVARALRHYRDESQLRVHAVDVEDVFPGPGRLDDLHRNPRALLPLVHLVCAVRTRHRHVRNERDAAPSAAHRPLRRSAGTRARR